MHWITTLDLRNWSKRRNCQETLPQLIRKLIRATSNSIKNIKFPSGENVLIGGWDGILEVVEGTEYFPEGFSVWEFGADKNIKGKADRDYKKRSENPLGENPSKTTYIFVTPRLWTKADEWINGKKEDRIWKDVRVIDAEVLEEWLEIAPTVASWLAIKHIGKYPKERIQPTDDFWEEWSIGPEFNLSSQLLLGGRQKEANKIIESINGTGVVSVQGFSREEALAFIVSCFKNDESKEEEFFARSIIVDDPEIFRKLSIHNNPLILIPRFEDTGIINRAASKGHTVIFPLGADAKSNLQEKIVLPKIDRDSFVDALVKVGIESETAEKYSKESARNITILRRQLGFERSCPEWANPEYINDIIPALIVGRWDDRFENDRNVISKIAKKPYEEYLSRLKRWLFVSDAPIIQIGNYWRLTSPLDSWTNASSYLTKHDFEQLKILFLEIFREIDPSLELKPEDRHMASIHEKSKSYSDWIREGIVQSMIVVGVFGDKLRLDLPTISQNWVDEIIFDILNSEDVILWKSFEDKLPLIAEASPIGFLNSLEKNLDVKDSPIMQLFDEEDGFITPTTYHTGLLWALEGTAWIPEYLSRAALILYRLSVNDPGGSIQNRPINSLLEIFKPWHHQTIASSNERIEVLNLISKNGDSTAWKFLCELLPSPHDIGHFTNKMRWRLFDETIKPKTTFKEIWDMTSSIVDLLISLCDFDERKISLLIEKSEYLSVADRAKVMSFITSNIDKITQTNYSVWHRLRKILSHHRSYPDEEWSLSEKDLFSYENMFNELQPKDEITKSIWMFDNHIPDFPEGFDYKSEGYDERDHLIKTRRHDSLKSIYLNHGIKKIKELCSSVGLPWLLGETLASIVVKKSEIIYLCNFLNMVGKELQFIQAFLVFKNIEKGFDWIIDLYHALLKSGFENNALAELLIPHSQNKILWDFVDSTNDEIKEKYWQKMSPHFYNLNKKEKIKGVRKLLLYKRYLTALNVCDAVKKDLPSSLVVEALEKAATENSNEETRLTDYRVNSLFEFLDKRDDVAHEVLVRLEWFYLSFLSTYGRNRSLKLLHNELSQKPAFFSEVLQWIYKSNSKKPSKNENMDLTEEQIKNRASNAYRLIRSWEQIPGINASGNINFDALGQWIDEARELADKSGRLDAADTYIGKILAQQYNIKNKNWLSQEISQTIERIYNETIGNGFFHGIYNKRGTVTKSAYEGGGQEKELSNHFDILAKKNMNKYPKIASIFESLKKTYAQEAKSEDERAERRKLEY